MIDTVEFKNFKILNDATLPLGRFTLIVGPNGCGKSTAIHALHAAADAATPGTLDRYATVGLDLTQPLDVEVLIRWAAPDSGATTRTTWRCDAPCDDMTCQRLTSAANEDRRRALEHELDGLRAFALLPDAVAAPAKPTPDLELAPNGANLPAVLETLRDQHPDRFHNLNGEFTEWLPEFDRILIHHADNRCNLSLRTRRGQNPIPADSLSQGSLLALTLLTLAHLPAPPPIICIEEPDRAIHPRLLRDVRDALYRLAYPDDAGESRPPVQVIATTHSPYFLDQFADQLDEIILVQRDGQRSQFQRLIDQPDIREILEETNLGDAWYSGILGGVPEPS
jgi:predicted ATPase